jgi:thiol-disulfide isomerase/thioredoxin
MKRLILSSFLFLSGSLIFGQAPSIIKITDLEKRINNHNDTIYIVNFWATWCAPCVKELPDFDSISKIYRYEKVKVLLISMDFKEDLDKKVIPFLKKKKLNPPTEFTPEVYILDETNGNYFIPKVSDKWTGAIPATLILKNSNGYRNFHENKLSYADLEKEIELIKQKH